jgi:hypothetical protein
MQQKFRLHARPNKLGDLFGLSILGLSGSSHGVMEGKQVPDLHEVAKLDQCRSRRPRRRRREVPGRGVEGRSAEISELQNQQ